MRASLHAVLADKARGQKRNRPLDRGHLQPTASAQLSRNVGPYGLRAATAGTVQCSITKLSTKPGQLHSCSMDAGLLLHDVDKDTGNCVGLPVKPSGWSIHSRASRRPPGKGDISTP